MDSICAYDSVVFTEELGVFTTNGGTVIAPLAAPAYLGANTLVASASLSMSQMSFDLEFLGPIANELDVLLHVEVNGTVTQAIPFTIPAGATFYRSPLPFSPTISLVAADEVRLLFSSQDSTPYEELPWMTITAVLGASITWGFDSTLPAGTYCTYRQM
jgi:hypothetical protein